MTIRWGIVGCGDVCEVKSGPAFSKVDGSERLVVSRRNAELAADYARRHGVPRWTHDARALIHDPDVDAVYVATPPGTHCEYALEVAAAGKPCYVEKPMARCHAECARMLEAFGKAGQKLFVAYYRRAMPRFEKVRELLADDALGTLTSVLYRGELPLHEHDDGELPWRLRAAESGGGLFFDLGSHVLDLIDHLLGPLENVGGAAVNRGGAYAVEDGVAASFVTGRGVPGVASWNFAAAGPADRLEFVGTHGRLWCSVFGDEPIQLQRGERTEAFDAPKPEHVHQPLIETVLAELTGRGTCPSTGESAARTARVMDTIVESYYGTREPGFWNDEASWPGRNVT